MKKLFAKIKKKVGFTLTELIVVVAILGVLAAVATPSVLGYISDAEISSDAATASELQNAIKRQTAKGKLSSTETAAATIVDAIKGEFDEGAIPQCSQTDYKYYFDTVKRKVEAKNDLGVDDVPLN